MPLGVLFVNRVHRAGFDRESVERLQQRVAKVSDRRERTLATEVLNRAREELGWTAINGEYLERLAQAVRMPLVEVPFVFAEEFGADEVQAVAQEIATDGAVTARGAGFAGA